MIRLANITKIFHQKTPDEICALSDISLEICRGDFITVIGSNGAGKSTLLNIVAGTVLPSSGSIFLNDRDISKIPEYTRARFIGRIFQNPLLGTASNMTIEDNMVLSMKKGNKGLVISLNARRRRTFAEALSSLGMGLEHRMKENTGMLSGGQRQALTLLMMTQSQPELILLDEHTAALDPVNAEKIILLTKSQIAERGLTTLMVTHNMEQAIQLGNRLIMMDRGEIIAHFSGKEKAALTVKRLIKLFEKVRHRSLASDEMLLA